MTKEIAEEIIRLHIKDSQIENEKYDLMKKLDLVTWDQVCTEAMKFLIGISNVKS